MTDANGSCSLYQYSLLSSETSIRLLELHPGHAGDELEISLRQTELEDAGNYETISYAWGDPTHKTKAHCDGKIVMLTRNLKQALLRLRLKDRPRTLWADAICINQRDDMEKGAQVKLMGKIYGRATRVCVWLGYATAEVQPAFKLIHEIVSHADPAITLKNELPNPASDCWSALGLFFSAAWFNRLWVVQEVYGHPCMMFCGEHELQWKDVVLVADFLLDATVPGKLTPLYPVNLGNVIGTSKIDRAGDSVSTSGIFDRFRGFLCSNQRDKVYALLSFPPLSDLQPPIQPDYCKTVAEVFEEATVRIFQSSQNLGLLSSLEHGSAIDEEGWPSWVPRWDRFRTTQILHNYSSGRVHSTLPRMKHRPAILTLEGVRISTMSWCGEVIESVPAKSRHGKSEVDHIKQPLQELLSRYLADVTHLTDSVLLCIAMTLTAGLDLDSNCPPLDMSQLRLDFLSYLAGILTSQNAMPGTMQRLLEISKEDRPTGDGPRFYSTARRGSNNKRLFCTENGEFGVAPRAAQSGDLIILFYGSNAPCVLRRKDLYYQFVGECYMHHHMHGEVIEMAAEDPSVIEEFELR